jgi:hypothetical protein
LKLFYIFFLIIFFPAVVNGGFSTFLAFILLSNSESHVFLVFFKIFFLVVVLGLYFGLVVLPVVLSWIGPTHVPHGIAPIDEDDDDTDRQVKADRPQTTIAVRPKTVPLTPVEVKPVE